MSVLISFPAKCEVRAVIRYLNAKGMSAVEIHCEIVSVYGENIMSRQHVTKWVRNFTFGRTEIHDEARSGRPSIVTDDMVQKIEENLLSDRRITIDDLHELCPEISRTVVHEIVSDRLKYRKLCARWVPKMLTEEHKNNRVSAAREFLERYETEGETFLNSVVTGDETWVYHHTPESKRQSMQWRHTHSPSAKKCKTQQSAQKIMASVFWDRKGLLLIEFLERGETINAARYCETMKKLRRAIKNKRRGMLTTGISLLHDNARPHTARATQELLTSFGWDVLNHPSHSPDLAPSDYHLFTKLKEYLGGKHFSDDDEVKIEAENWLKGVARDFYDTGIKKLVPRLEKCIELNGDFVEK